MKRLLLASTLFVCGPALAQVAPTPPGQTLASAVPSITASGGTAPRATADRAADWLGPVDFLTSGETQAMLTSGLIDATPFFNAALAAAGTVYVPCGSYLFNSNLTLAANAKDALVGRSQGCVTFNLAGGGTTPFISVPGGNSNFEVRNITFHGLPTHRAGIVLSLAAFQTVIDNVTFSGYRAEDIGLGPANTTRINSVDFRPDPGGVDAATGACIFMNGPTETVLSNITMYGCGMGINDAGSAGTYLTNVDIIGSRTNAIVLNPTGTGAVISAFRGQNVLVDTTRNGNGFLIEGTGPIVDVNMTQMWASATGQSSSTAWNAYSGIYIDNPHASAIQFDGLFGESNGLALFDIEQGSHITVANAKACNESQHGPGASAAMVVGAGANYVTINNPTGGQCGFTGSYLGLPNKASYGLIINSTATTNHYTLIGKSGFDATFASGSIYWDPADPNMVVEGDGTTVTQHVRNFARGTADTVQPTDYWINLATGAAVTETLPVCSSTTTAGRVLIIRDGSGSAGTENDTIQAPAGGTTVNGTSAIKISSAHGGKMLTCNGISDWGAVSTQ